MRRPETQGPTTDTIPRATSPTDVIKHGLHSIFTFTGKEEYGVYGSHCQQEVQRQINLSREIPFLSQTNQYT
jgi:hypothetical protein